MALCLTEALKPPAHMLLSHRTSLRKHRFKDKMSKNFTAQPQAQGLPKCRALGHCTAARPGSQRWVDMSTVRNRGQSNWPLVSFGAQAKRESVGLKVGRASVLPPVLLRPGYIS